MKKIVNLAAITVALIGALTMAAPAGAATSATPSYATQPAVPTSDVGILVSWPFNDCHRRNHARGILPWRTYYVYDHTDGRTNYYRVHDYWGNVVGNGWASCAE